MSDLKKLSFWMNYALDAARGVLTDSIDEGDYCFEDEDFEEDNLEQFFENVLEDLFDTIQTVTGGGNTVDESLSIIEELKSWDFQSPRDANSLSGMLAEELDGIADAILIEAISSFGRAIVWMAIERPDKISETVRPYLSHLSEDAKRLLKTWKIGHVSLQEYLSTGLGK
jgi:hypothetical protein